MKLPLFALLAAFAISAATVSAQKPPRDVDEVITDSRVKRMATELSLTDDQKTKVRPLVLEEVKKFKAIRADESLTEQQRVQQEKEFREASRSKFKTILNEEQMTKYEEMQKPKKAKKPAPAK